MTHRSQVQYNYPGINGMARCLQHYRYVLESILLINSINISIQNHSDSDNKRFLSDILPKMPELSTFTLVGSSDGQKNSMG